MDLICPTSCAPDCPDCLPHDVEACRAVLLDRMTALGIEATVSTAPPIIPTAYDQTPMRCPHGTTFHMAPTGEQIAQWRRDGIR